MDEADCIDILPGFGAVVLAVSLITVWRAQRLVECSVHFETCVERAVECSLHPVPCGQG